MFSVVIPTYGRPDNLRRAITSVFNQTCRNFELIVVDDNDSDTEDYELTGAVVSSFRDQNIRFLRHGTNRNGSAARNTGLRACLGEYAIFLDDDDELFPNCLSEVERFLLERKALFFYWLAEWRVNGKVVNISSFQKTGRILVDVLSVNTDMNTSCLCIETDLLKEVGGFNESLKRHQDVEMIARANLKQDIEVLNTVLACRHLDSKSNQPVFSIFRENKNKFLEILSPMLENISKEDKEVVHSAHAFQLWAYAVKSLEFRYVFGNLDVIYRSRVHYRKFYKKTVIFLQKIFLSVRGK